MLQDDELSQIRSAELKTVNKKKHDKGNKENVCLQNCSSIDNFKEKNKNALNQQKPPAITPDEFNRVRESLKETTT